MEKLVDPITFLRKHLITDGAEPHPPDHLHPHWRRHTAKYRRKQGICKNLWIGSGLIMCLSASLEVVIGLGLGTTFLSFMILDDTG